MTMTNNPRRFSDSLLADILIRVFAAMTLGGNLTDDGLLQR
jgi:hypothetical protein